MLRKVCSHAAADLNSDGKHKLQQLAKKKLH